MTSGDGENFLRDLPIGIRYCPVENEARIYSDLIYDASCFGDGSVDVGIFSDLTQIDSAMKFSVR